MRIANEKTGHTTVVVKVGGEVLLDAAQRAGLAENVRDLVAPADGGDGEGDGAPPARVVIVHGGGPQATALQTRLGLVATKVAGQRVTSRDDLRVVQQAVCGEVNVALVCALLEAGVRAFGCHGASAGLVRATKRPPMIPTGQVEAVDYGEVGDIQSVDADLVRALCDLGLVPVIATLGVDPAAGRAFNVNADTTAASIARALRADALLLVTAVGGVFRDVHDPASRIPLLTRDGASTLIAEGTLTGGMIPKVEEALAIVDGGVGAVAILGAAQSGSFRSALNGDGAHGTRVTRS
jgi:acetylglutamate kinase